MIERVELGAKSYDIVIEKNSLQRLGAWAKELITSNKVCVITDDLVATHYLVNVKNELRNEGINFFYFVVEQGEKSKSMRVAESIQEFLMNHQFSRSDALIALGGGVVGDLTGFVASTYMRGIDFLQVPTTLLSQVDASVGGKTAVNLPQAKNSVGTFYQPKGVLIDPLVLGTLEKRRLREGMAEVIKCGLIADKTLTEEIQKMKNESELPFHVESFIAKSIRVKKKLVEEDEFDRGNRKLLNFGHTIGHAVEAVAGFGEISHGEAVAIGMVAINRFAIANGWTPSDTIEVLMQQLQKFHLPTEMPSLEQEKVFEALVRDKKSSGDKVDMVVLERIGKAMVKTVEQQRFKEVLEGEKS